MQAAFSRPPSLRAGGFAEVYLDTAMHPSQIVETQLVHFQSVRASRGASRNSLK